VSERFHPDGDRIPEPERPGLIARARGHLMDVTPLRVSRDFRSLFIGRSISDFGDGIVEVVVPYEVYRITGSTLAVGLLGLCTLIPVLVFPIVGGAVADAVERRRLVVITHALLALLSLLLALNSLLPEPMLWPLYVFAALSAGVGTFNRPALSTWPARLLAPDQLPSANALESGIGSLDYMVAPVVAGFLILLIEPAGVFLVDVVTFLVVIAMVLRMKPSPPAEDAEHFSWGSIKEGFRFLKGKRTIQSVFLADLNAMVFGFPLALFPALVAQRFGGSPVVLGLLYGAIAAGSLLASVFSGRAKHVRRQGRAIMVAIAVWGGAIVVFGFSWTVWLSLLMLTVAGAGDMVSGIFRMTILQTAVEERFRGRLDGIGMAVWATGPSLGDLESGVVASLWTVQGSIVSGGILTVVGIGALRWFAPGFWNYDARHPTP
jgi:MFS family permease